MTPEKLTFLQMFMASFKISDIYLVGEERGRPLLIISIVIKDLIAPSKLNFFLRIMMQYLLLSVVGLLTLQISC